MSEIVCPICTTQTEDIADAKGGKVYHKCRACEFIFLDKTRLLSDAEEKTRYLKHADGSRNPEYIKLLTDFISAIKSAAGGNPIKSALDFGCGHSPVMPGLLEQEGIQTDLYDIHFYPEKTYAERKYDLISMVEVLEHLKNPAETLSELTLRLNPGGILAVMTLFHPRDPGEFIDWWYRMDETHLCFFSKTTFNYIEKLFNLRIINTDEKRICIFSRNR